MKKEDLQKLIEKGLSTYGIAEELATSQTNVRYWLRKFGLNTNFLPQRKEKRTCKNGKSCSVCGRDLTGAQRFFCSSKCKAKVHYNNANTTERQARVSKERKLRLIKMSGGGCEVCGYNKNYAALIFHHLNPENKSFSLDARKLSNTNWESIEKEWQKCQLLCSNCHAEIHFPDKVVVLE